MSGLSISVTLVLPHEVAAPFAAPVEVDELKGLPEFPDKDHFLYASSRNNHMDHDLRVMLKAYQPAGTAYFRPWDEIIGRPSWIVSLRGRQLDDAVQGIGMLIMMMRENLEQTESLFEGGVDADELADALYMDRPFSFAEARGLYDEYCERSDGGDDVWCLVSYLHAHALLLKEAYESDMSVVYAVQLY